MMGGMGWMFHGVSRGLPDEESFGKVYDRRVVTRLIPYILPNRSLVAFATVAMLAYTGTMVLIPWLIKLGIDGFIAKENTSGLMWVFVFFIGTAVVGLVSNYTQQITIAKVGEGVLYNLRRDMFAHLQKLSLSFYDKTEVGRIMPAFTATPTNFKSSCTLS